MYTESVSSIPANTVWLSLCLLVQVVVTVLPQGAPVCVRSLMAWRPASLFVAQADVSRTAPCCTCCSATTAHTDAPDDAFALDHGDNGDPDPAPAPGREPCRDPRCTLCVRAPDAVTQARIAPDAPLVRIIWHAAPRAAPGSSIDERTCREHRGRSPPDILGDRSRTIVGLLILQV